MQCVKDSYETILLLFGNSLENLENVVLTYYRANIVFGFPPNGSIYKFLSPSTTPAILCKAQHESFNSCIIVFVKHTKPLLDCLGAGSPIPHGLDVSYKDLYKSVVACNFGFVNSASGLNRVSVQSHST